MRYVLATALAASAAVCPGIAAAREAAFQINVGAIDLTDALATLATQAGISLATDGPIPRGRANAVSGRMTVREALDRLLRGSELRAVRVGANTYRVVRRKRDAPVVPPRETAVQPAADIVISARKLPEALSNVAAPVAVYIPDDTARPGVATTSHTVAAATEGLTLTNFGPGRDRPFIRGIADSPFNGFSQSTVSVQIDDGRVTYDAADPGLRLVDVARVEVLKGPQGPLYGTGALGGLYRVVTNRPVLGGISGSGALGFSSMSGGGIGGQGEAVLNVPLVSDRIALRLAGYASIDGGWVDDASGRRDSNRSFTYGGRAALRIAPADGWTVDLAGLLQSIDVRDSQYVDREAENLTRNVPIREPRTGRVRMTQGTLAGPVGTLQLTIATSFTWQDQADIFDAGASAEALGRLGATIYRDRRAYRVFDQEIRLSSATDARFSWLVGASYLSATTLASGDLSIIGQRWSSFFQLHRSVSEAALFGDGSLRLSPRLKLSGGIRLFRATTDDERTEDSTQAIRGKSLAGITPSASLSYEVASDQLIYLRVGTAFRPGGIDPANTVTGRYDADQVVSLDLGTRLRLDGARLLLDGGFFASNWIDIQSDYLEPTGLIATHNAGTARNIGAEISLDWRPGGGWRLKSGVTWQRPRLVTAADGTDQPDDRRLPIVPDIAARLMFSRDFDVAGWRFTPQIEGNVIGATRLSFDPGLDRRMPGYAVIQAGINADHDGLALRLGIDNVFDGRPDTFAFGNPFSVRTTRQYTPTRPRTISMSIAKHF